MDALACISPSAIAVVAAHAIRAVRSCPVTARPLRAGLSHHGPRLARRSAAQTTEIAEPVSAEALATRAAMKRWLDGLLWGYVGLIGADLHGARGAHHDRAASARTCDHHLSQPQGAGSARMVGAGGKPRISSGTRIELRRAGEMLDLPRAREQRCRSMSRAVGPDERATLERIAAPIPMCGSPVSFDRRTTSRSRRWCFAERPIYRAQPSALESERDVVLFYCDFANSRALARDHMAHDVLFAFKRYAESACRAIRSAGGTICYVDHDNIFALFGLSGDLDRACRSALVGDRGHRAIAACAQRPAGPGMGMPGGNRRQHPHRSGGS